MSTIKLVMKENVNLYFANYFKKQCDVFHLIIMIARYIVFKRIPIAIMMKNINICTIIK